MIGGSVISSEADWREMRTFAWLTLTYHMHRLLPMATSLTWKLSGLPLLARRSTP